ncbi:MULTISPECIES: hypothetical protein [Rhodococcus]|jgi:hypothetical protein|uniref:Uncharacterized protein n=1 Tax=Rhodococcus oxybenzonivorans TaxID=1990687 RepID=A0AAE5A8J4_9NOCA|nr:MULTISPECIES: hypothetical protein [Rhodococcus]MDV7246005.1 hypothetical protein [Rhodococcus oxybenzonivorans]MDV7268040.1 hypothetical protein [Rhodococcus oxybenzonivorans]MDV7277600.1 hypothetical protein [Rhodococcus oxybenzonivorans]MDV7337018.1 hypothetical protein [Rhodococcus oxybenzonivorans]MDV7347388.1 hypothetical protein [Rhodococcus oxybenzonivorans]
MNTEQRKPNDSVIDVSGDLFASMFSLDLGDGDVDYDAVERIHDGEFGEWTLAAARSGLFPPHAVEALQQSWQKTPRSLLDALLTDADEMTRKRCNIIWAGLDEASSFDTAEYA